MAEEKRFTVQVSKRGDLGAPSDPQDRRTNVTVRRPYRTAQAADVLVEREGREGVRPAPGRATESGKG
ncbi:MULTISPECIES: hypothetical protein [unclassified Streptomyces]|uniref:Uncharacterized protein n=1 Tax=Streptomyces sp. NBC_00060 TaxID=2975636 RepID=A0AAU2HFE4_9ACTN